MGAPFKLKNGSIAVSVEAPGGLYNSAHLKKLATLSEQQSLIMKATEDQRIVLFVAPDQEEALTKELASGGMAVRAFQDGVHQPVACLGALCPDSQQDALKASLDISEAIAGIEASSCLKIGLNGCGKCCVPCHTMDISVVGTEEGYRISIGGKQSLVPEFSSFLAEGIPAGEIVDKVKAVVDTWLAVAEQGEPLHATVERIGMAPFIDVLAPYSGDAAGALDATAGEPLSTDSEDNNMVDEANQQVEGNEEAPAEETAATEVPAPEEPEVMAPESVTDEQAVAEAEGSDSGVDISADDESTPTSELPEEEVEAAVAASIDEEAAVPEIPDDNAAEREEMLDALQDAAPNVESNAESNAGGVEEVADEVSGSDMAVEPLIDQNVGEQSTNDVAASDSDSEMNLVPITSSESSESVSEFVSEPMEANSSDDPVEASVEKSVSFGSPAAIQSLAGMEIDQNGRFVLVFEGSASITVDPTIIPFGGSRCIKFAGKELKISADATGFNVEVDGLTFHMPLDAAA